MYSENRKVPTLTFYRKNKKFNSCFNVRWETVSDQIKGFLKAVENLVFIKRQTGVESQTDCLHVRPSASTASVAKLRKLNFKEMSQGWFVFL